MAYDVIIIGGGVAGLTAALYTCRAGKSVLVLEKENPGGQINWSPCVENYPGLAHVSGSELSDRLLAQVMDQGGDVELEEVTGIEDGSIKKVATASGTVYESRSLIAATGARPRKMGLPEEEKYIGNGECFCALCDGAFYAHAPVAVCGGGNAALQDALYLSKTCSTVYLIHRRNQFRGEAKLVELLEKMPNVEFILNARVTGLYGSDALEGITVEDAEGKEKGLAVDGLFVAIGRVPDNKIFSGILQLDESGYILAGDDCKTGVPGIFAAGDGRRKQVRQLVTAASDGAVAATEACRFLDSLN